MSLTPNQQQFFELIDATGSGHVLKPFWNIEAAKLSPDHIQEYQNVLSDGERQLLYFFANLWLGKNQYPFDLFYAASKLDSYNKQLINDWFEEPFWP